VRRCKKHPIIAKCHTGPMQKRCRQCESAVAAQHKSRTARSVAHLHCISDSAPQQPTHHTPKHSTPHQLSQPEAANNMQPTAPNRPCTHYSSKFDLFTCMTGVLPYPLPLNRPTDCWAWWQRRVVHQCQPTHSPSEEGYTALIHPKVSMEPAWKQA
jgi:hypothetical protein